MDFLAIGDTTVDEFIRLKDATVACDINSEHCTITMRWGDKIPFEFSVAVPGVGNAANAAVSAARLGLSAGLVCDIGTDRLGDDILAYFGKEKIATNYVKRHADIPTNHHFVLWYGPERTILIKQNAYPYEWPAIDATRLPKAVYLSSLGENSGAFHDAIATWLEQNPQILFAFQPGTYQMVGGVSKFARIYKRTNVFIANKEEYQRILGSAEEDAKKLMEMMRANGPEICFLTDGPDGAYALSDEGSWKIGLYPDGENAYERTGAGDAFASTAVVALMLGKTVSEALTWSPVNSASVVQKVGAQEGLVTRQALDERLAKAPSDYKAIPF